MTDPPGADRPRSERVDSRGVGICAACRHSRRVSGARSEFWMCGRAAADPSFPRYPQLPVLSCRGYQARS